MTLAGVMRNRQKSWRLQRSPRTGSNDFIGLHHDSLAQWLCWQRRTTSSQALQIMLLTAVWRSWPVTLQDFSARMRHVYGRTVDDLCTSSRMLVLFPERTRENLINKMTILLSEHLRATRRPLVNGSCIITFSRSVVLIAPRHIGRGSDEHQRESMFRTVYYLHAHHAFVYDDEVISY